MAVIDAQHWTGRERFGATVARLLRLSWPIVLARIGIQTMGLTDAVVVGRFSARELGYQALGWAPTSVILVAGIGLLTGVQVMAARRVGEGRPDLAGAVLRRGLVYAAALGVAATAMLMLFGPALLLGLGMEPDLARGAARTMRVLALSLTPYLLSCVLSFWLEGLARPKPGLVAMWAANAVNLALNLVFVPGAIGWMPGGAVGSGWATVASRVTLLVWLAVYVWRMPEARGYGVFATAPSEPEAAKEQRRIGYGAGASYFVEAGAFVGMNVVTGWLGPLALAAWAVVLNFSALVFMVPLGIAGATAVLVGQAYGARDRRGVILAAQAGFAIAAAIALAITIGAALFSRAIVSAYATDAVLLTLSATTLFRVSPFFVPDAIQAVAAQALRARGDVLWPTLTHIASYAVLMLPLGWALAHPFHLGLDGCVVAIVVASFLAAGLLLARFALLTLTDRRGG